MTRILAIGDPHFRTDNITETQQFSRELEHYILENETDILIVLGDILHTHEKLHTSALNAAVDFFKMLTSFDKEVFVLVGNHDAISNTIFLTTNHWLNALKQWDNINIIDYPTKHVINKKGEFIILCPYVPDGRLVEALNLVDDWKSSRIVFAHQLLDGAKMGMIVAKDVEEWLDEYPLCVSGHIHDKQQVKPNLYYTGSSLQHSFGESSDKSLCLIVVKSSIEMEEVYLSIKRKKIIYAEVEELQEISQKIIDKNNKEDVEYKIVLKGNVEDFKALKKSSLYKEAMLIENIKNITFKSNLPEIIVKQDETNENTISEYSDDFCHHLHRLVEATDNPYLISLCNHILYDKEDISDKDVLIL